MRAFAIILSILLVASAGCATDGGPTGSTSTTDGESMDGASAGTAAGRTTTLTLPDWASESGIDEVALASSHVDAMRSSSGYTYHMNQTVVENGTQRGVSIVREVDFDAGRVHLRQESFGQNEWEVDEAYVTRDAVFSRLQTDAGTEYSTTERPDDEPPITEQVRTRIESREGYRVWLSAWTFSPAGTVERDGVEFLRFTANEFNESKTELSLTADARPEATLLVTRDGRIREFDQRFSGDDGEMVRIRFRITDFGDTSVVEPPWLDRAREGGDDS